MANVDQGAAPRFIVASAGTHGDVFPFIGLCDAMRRAGCDVTLAANASYRADAERLGLSFVPLATDGEMDSLLNDPDVWHPTKSAIVGARWGVKTMRRQFETLREAAQGGDVVLVAPPTIFPARLVEEAEGVPLVSVYYMPWMIASSIAPPAMTSGYTLPRGAPRWAGAAYWWSVDVIAWLLLGRELNRLRQELQLPPVRRIFSWHASPTLPIGLFPEWYAERPSDWPANLRLTDFPAYQGEEGVHETLAIEFSQRGAAPVAFTFGTGMRHADRLLDAAVQSCAEGGHRGLILSRHQYAESHGAMPHAVRFEYARLDHVLPHCCCLVHHGGIGTTAAGMRAGVPQVIIPHAWDQLDNARRVERLGAGVHLPRKRATAKRLTSAIHDALALAPGCHELPAKKATASLDDAAGWLKELAAGKLD